MAENSIECEKKNKRRHIQQKNASKTFSETKSHKTIENRNYKEIIVLKLQRKIVQDEKYSLEEEIRWYELELSNQNWNQTVDYKGYSSVSKQYLF